jgi:cytochrome c oxidase subunit 2
MRPSRVTGGREGRAAGAQDGGGRTGGARLRIVGLATSLTIVLGGCVSNATQDTLKAKGSSARLMNSLLFPVFWIAVVVFVLVAGLVCAAVFRFRARSDDEAPKQVHGNTRMEIGWTIAPALLLACIAVPTVKFVFDVSAIPRNAMTVVVTGHRWWWQADYMSQSDPNQTLFTTATELHIPVKTNVVISLTSVDVIHNFWVPELAGKLYAIPGRHNKLVIEADKPGTYYGQCAEYCGTSHANMRLRVIAQNQDDYNAWQAHEQEGPVTPVVAAAPASSSSGGAAGSTGATGTGATGSTGSTGAAAPSTGSAASAATGAQLFTSAGCAGCHAIGGISSGVVGPNLTHFNSRSVFAGGIFANSDNNLRLWLANPPREKPGSVMPNLNLSADQIDNLVAYLDSLK